MSYTNLWDETIKALKEKGYGWDDVVHVFVKDGCCITKENFEKIAKTTNYDNGFGCGVEGVPMGLIIAGTDFWFSRCEYDRATWWGFNKYPEIPNQTREVNNIWQATIYDGFQNYLTNGTEWHHGL